METTLLDVLAGRASQARPEPDFLVYPSLLDKFQSLLDYENEAEQPWNKWSEASIAKAREEYKRRSQGSFLPVWVEPEPGSYILSPDEMYDKIEEELVAQINREPSEPSEAADRGTALNEIIDCMLMGVRSTRDDCALESLRLPSGELVAVRALIDGFCFDFDPALCFKLKKYLKGSACQCRLQADIDTRYGAVRLYGYADYILADRIIDLKTTTRYEFGKYERKWQRWVYPYCAVESGACAQVSSFEYLAAVLRVSKHAPISAEAYPESYGYDHAKAKAKIRQHLEAFIAWLTSPEVRCRITDKKIFNQKD